MTMVEVTTGTAATLGPLVDSLLAEQQSLTAVDRFAQRHQSALGPVMADHYRDLIPLSWPKPGEQYAFEVDLDACSGCKACVAACHKLNGLDEHELWRNVGVLYGGTDSQPFLQHVTTACHHCLEPACLTGCPVNAYEKDPVTGIVRHLDDQCIGCQYCVFMCPYDVPRYSSAKGIVRKCDMCHDRLAVGEAPACVQSCPNQAIRIRTAGIDSIVEHCETGQFVPTAPDPRVTFPSTMYKSRRSMPRNVLPADYFSATPQHSHLALVVMLVLTQLSVGAFVVGQALVWGPWADPLMRATIRPVYAMVGVILGLMGIGAAVFHLGRPRYAHRALLGLRTSWLSREILAFAGFAALAVMQAAAVMLAIRRPAWNDIADLLGIGTVAAGVAAVGCSIMIYACTGRPLWSLHRTATRFLLSCAVLGLPIALFVSLLVGAGHTDFTAADMMREYGQRLCGVIILTVVAKLLSESAVFAELRRRQFTPLKRSAVLLADNLGMTTMLRYFFGVVGGLLFPAILLSERATLPGTEGFHPLFLCAMVTLVFGTLLIGELLERYLFFAASASARMPGAAGT
jgi:Fe-S-cluster-containing dehydrogenase component/DMSO reductase anchor subunit